MTVSAPGGLAKVHSLSLPTPWWTKKTSGREGGPHSAAERALSVTLARWCPWCGQDPLEVEGCRPKTVRGRQSLRHAWPADDGVPADNPCGCLARVDRFHHWMCSWEPCPWASGEDHERRGEQLLYCGCYERGDSDD